VGAFKHLTTETFRSVRCSQWKRNRRTNEVNHAFRTYTTSVCVAGVSCVNHVDV